jgi:HK97 family phage major capsid protein
MNAFPRLQTKGLENSEGDEATIEKIVEQFGNYHTENKQLLAGVNGELKTLRDQLSKEAKEREELELRMSRRGIGGNGGDGRLDEAKALAIEFMRSGAVEGKALSRASDPDGGYTLQDQLDTMIQDQLISISPVRKVARVMQLGAGVNDFKLPVGRRGASSSWVGESSTRSETDTPNLGMVTPPGGEIMSYAKVTQWLIDDSAFNIEAWLNANIADEHAFQEGAAFITGNGISKPEGFLSGTPTTDADSARLFGTLKYVASGVSGAFPASNPADKLIDLVFDLSSAYRAGASWMMNSNAAATVRKFKDGQGAYIWQQALTAGQPDMLLGYPVTYAEDMADLAANSLSIAFGNFKRGYLIVDKLGTRMVRDPYTAPGWIKFYIFKRVHGAIADSNAIRVMKFAAS